MSDRKLTPVAKALIDAKKLIEDEKNWCRGHLETTGPNGQVQRCALGALDALETCSGLTDIYLGAWRTLTNSCKKMHGAGDIVYVNNELGHAAILSCFDHAISKALSEGK